MGSSKFLLIAFSQKLVRGADKLWFITRRSANVINQWQCYGVGDVLAVPGCKEFHGMDSRDRDVQGIGLGLGGNLGSRGTSNSLTSSKNRSRSAASACSPSAASSTTTADANSSNSPRRAAHQRRVIS